MWKSSRDGLTGTDVPIRLPRVDEATIRIELNPQEVAHVRESLDHSIRSVEEWWAREGQSSSAEVGRAKLTELKRLREKFKATQPSRR